MCMPTWILPAEGAMGEADPEVCERHDMHAS